MSAELTVDAHRVARALGRAPPAAVQDPRVGEHAGAGGCADCDEAARGVLGLAVDQGHHIGLFGEEGVAAEVAVAPGCRGEGSQGSKQASGDRACGLTDDIGRAILKIELWNSDTFGLARRTARKLRKYHHFTRGWNSAKAE